MTRWIWLAMLIAICGVAQAQSFDCRQAADEVDEAICNTPELRQLDTRLGEVWRNFRDHHPELFQQARSEGLAWYKQRKLCAQEQDIVGCVREAEVARIDRLNAMAEPSSQEQSSPTTASVAPNDQGAQTGQQTAQRNSCLDSCRGSKSSCEDAKNRDDAVAFGGAMGGSSSMFHFGEFMSSGHHCDLDYDSCVSSCN